MFIGEYQVKVDEKGRVSIPAKFRAAFKKSSKQSAVVITRGLDKSLVVYDALEWKKIAEKLAQLPITQSTSRAFSRLMLSGAMDCEIDGQGRISVPQYLLDYAGVTKEAVFAGLYNRVELWSEYNWKEYKSKMESDADAIAEQMSAIG